MHDSTAPAGVPADQVKYYVAGYEDGFTGAANNREPNAQGAPVSMGYSGSVGTGATNTCVDDMPANSNGCYQELPQSNCLDDNEYGTVQGYYEVIRATKGQPGGVVIIW